MGLFFTSFLYLEFLLFQFVKLVIELLLLINIDILLQLAIVVKMTSEFPKLLLLTSEVLELLLNLVPLFMSHEHFLIVVLPVINVAGGGGLLLLSPLPHVFIPEQVRVLVVLVSLCFVFLVFLF